MNIPMVTSTESQNATVDFVEESAEIAPVMADIAADVVFTGVAGVEPVAADDIL